MINLETSRLILRDYSEKDEELYYRLKSHDKTMYYLQDIKIHSASEAREEFQNMLQDMNSKDRKLFSEDITAVDEVNLTVTIEITGGMKQITNIFTTMEQYGVISSSFTQKKATLEDVFLNLVDGQRRIVHE